MPKPTDKTISKSLNLKTRMMLGQLSTKRILLKTDRGQFASVKYCKWDLIGRLLKRPYKYANAAKVRFFLQCHKIKVYFFLSSSHNDVPQAAQWIESIVAHTWHRVCLS